MENISKQEDMRVLFEAESLPEDYLINGLSSVGY